MGLCGSGGVPAAASAPRRLGKHRHHGGSRSTVCLVLHGIHYREPAAAGLDALVYQSYPQAWAGFWLESYASRFDLAANIANISTITSAVAGTGTRVLYTLELGDSVERWWADPARTREQMTRLDPLAGGRFLVWANDLVARLGQPERRPMGNKMPAR